MSKNKNKDILEKYRFGVIIGYNIYQDLNFLSLCKGIKLISIGGVECSHPSQLLDYVLPITSLYSSKYLYNLIITTCLTFKTSI